MNKDLKDKAIDIKGKKYVLVSDRVIYFNASYPTGAIKTELISPVDAKMVVIRAIVTPDVSVPDRFFTGYSQATWGDGNVNRTSALENSETSSVGRALAMMGIGVLDSIASVDEMRKAGVTGVTKVVGKPTLDDQIDKVVDDLLIESVDPSELGVCARCGTPNIRYKTGRVGCGKYCWRNQPQMKT